MENVLKRGRVNREKEKKVVKTDTRKVVTIGMISAVAVVLMLFEIPLWFAPGFYQLDFSEAAVMIGAFALGPAAGIVIELLKNLLYMLLKGTSSAGVGEIANFLIGCSFILPASFIYYKKKTKKSAMTGLIIGTICLVIVGCLLNAYLLLPTYSKAYHMPIEQLVALGTAVNPQIKDLSGLVMFAVAPFNLLKGIIVSFVTVVLYKKLSSVIKRFHG